MTVFLRPQPSSIPVDYLRVLEKAGLVVMPQTHLAIYTCKSGPRQGTAGTDGATGPQGPAGVDQNSWYDTIIASAGDEFNPLTIGADKATFRAPYALDLATGYIRASVSTAPVGADLIIDVKMNGVTVFSTPLTIDAGERTSVTAAVPAVLSTTDIPDDAEFTVDISQVGSTTAGIGLKVAVTGIKTS